MAHASCIPDFSYSRMLQIYHRTCASYALGRATLLLSYVSGHQYRNFSGMCHLCLLNNLELSCHKCYGHSGKRGHIGHVYQKRSKENKINRSSLTKICTRPRKENQELRGGILNTILYLFQPQGFNLPQQAILRRYLHGKRKISWRRRSDWVLR